MKTIKSTAIAASFIVFTAASIFAASPPKGLLIYSEPPSTYAESCEFSAMSSGPAYTIVIRPDGQKFQMNSNAEINAVEYPSLNPQADTQEKASLNLDKIHSLERRFPQFNAQLQAAEAKWTNAMAFAKQMAANAAKVEAAEMKKAAIEAENKKREEEKRKQEETKLAAEKKKRDEETVAKLKIEQERLAAENKKEEEKKQKLADEAQKQTPQASQQILTSEPTATPLPQSSAKVEAQSAASTASAKSYNELVNACTPCPNFTQVNTYEKGKYYSFPLVKIAQATNESMLVYYTTTTYRTGEGTSKEEKLGGLLIFPNKTALESARMDKGAYVQAVGQFTGFKDFDMVSGATERLPVFSCPGLSINGSYFKTE
jgi:outer membrane biosynthesis protein TonB